MLPKRFEHLDLGLGLLVTRPGHSLQAVDPLLHRLEIGESEFDLDRLDIADGVGRPFDVHDVLVVEAADDMNDGRRLPDVAEELIAQSLALCRALDEPGDVHEFDRRRDHALRVDQRVEIAEAAVGYGDHARIRFDRAEGVILGLDAGGGERVENRALPDVGQADDAASESHRRRIFPNSLGSVMPG